MLQVGGNDDPALVPTGIACIRAFLDPAVPDCRETVGPQWPARLAAMAPKVEAAVADVRAAMRRAGYADPATRSCWPPTPPPVTERMIGAARRCRAARTAAPTPRGARTVAFPALSAALRGVAARAGARFLDLSRATEGREACSQAVAARRVAAAAHRRPGALVYGGLDASACTWRRSRSTRRPPGTPSWAAASGSSCDVRCRAACRAGADGHLHVAPSPPAAAA